MFKVFLRLLVFGRVFSTSSISFLLVVMVFDWITGRDKKDKKEKKERSSRDGKHGRSFKVTNDGTSTDRMKIDIGNISSDDQDRGAGAYKSNINTRRVLDKDELGEVKNQLEAKNHVLRELIGSGAYADVYRGRNNSTDRDVAIKIIKLVEENRHYQETFLQQEIQVVQQLNHKRIIRLYSIFQVDNKIVMVMEYADRGTMSDLIAKRGALREKAGWALFREMHSGLSYMHRNMVAHRDLKLENILINKHWVPKLADFSFSMVWDGKSLCSQFCGSVPYFAPEMLRTEPYIPLATDIWSMGVCLYIMTNDTFPFKIGDDEAMLQEQEERKWRLRPRTESNYSGNYKDLITQMLEPRVKKRIDAHKISSHVWITTDLSHRN